MKVAGTSDFKAPRKEDDEDIDVSELVQLNDAVKNTTAVAQEWNEDIP